MTYPTLSLVSAACLCLSMTADATTYKCRTADGKIEYSAVPCGPLERPAKFNPDATFSTYDRRWTTSPAGGARPVSDYDKKRQKEIADKAIGER